ncbi:hybrid signal transduction histidine kinase M [Tanacetum coccineum]
MSTPLTRKGDLMIHGLIPSSNHDFLTLSFNPFEKRLIKANPKTAKAAWDAIETIFQDNKRTRTISLKGELRVIQMGDQTADEYFSKIEAILTLLTDLGSLIPDLATVRSMVATEELRLRSRSSVLPTGTTLSAPQVLLAEASSRNQTGWNNRERDNRTTTREGTLPMHAGSQSGGLNVSQQQQLLQLLQAQQTMLAQFGFNGLSGQSRPTAPPGFQPDQQAFSPQQQALLLGTVQGRSFYLNSNATNLSTLFNSCMYPSVLVSDRKSIPVTNTGHSTLPTPYRPLHLNNLFIFISAASIGHIPPTRFIAVTMGSTALLLIWWRVLISNILADDKSKNDVYKCGSPFELFEKARSMLTVEKIPLVTEKYTAKINGLRDMITRKAISDANKAIELDAVANPRHICAKEEEGELVTPPLKATPKATLIEIVDE